MKLNKKLKKTRTNLKLEAKRVVILGAGEVGRHIAQRLATENYNVILIDENKDKVKDASFLADIGTYVGNACNPEVYFDINLNEKDLFIAVTNFDEVNLMACYIAKSVGCGIKIARVRNHFYTNFGDDALGSSFWRKLGVEILFNQDEITSAEIINLIENPGSVEAIDLGDHDMQLVAYRVKENSLLCGRRLIGLRDVPIFDNTLIVAAVRNSTHAKNVEHHKSPIHIKAPTEKSFSMNSKRESKSSMYQRETLIPKGDFRIHEGDILYISGLRKDINNIGHLFGSKKKKKIKHIFILAGSSLAILLAESLAKKYPRKYIYLIDNDKSNAHVLRNQVNPKINILLLDLHNIQGLVSEGLDEDCIFVGASDIEDNNVLACLLVKEETQARTIAVIQSSIYNHVMPYVDIDAAVSPKMLLVDDVLKSLRKNVYDVLFSKGGDAEVLEFVITEKFSHINKPLREIQLPDHSIVAAVAKGGKLTTPTGSTSISMGNHVIIFCLKGSIQELQSFFEK